MRFTVKSNFGQMAKHVRTTHAPRADKAARRATRQTLQAIEKAQVEELRRVIQAPTPWTLRSFRVWYPGSNSNEGKIVIRSKRDIGGSGVPQESVLTANVEGGSRAQKRSERALQKAGVLPPGWVTVPGRGARLDAYGNVSRGQVIQVLSWFEALAAGGKRKNSTIASRARKAKGTAKTAGVSFFAVQPGGRGLRPGIYTQTQKGAPTMVLAFVRRAVYRARYSFAEVADKVAKAVHPVEFSKALREIKA